MATRGAAGRWGWGCASLADPAATGLPFAPCFSTFSTFGAPGRTGCTRGPDVAGFEPGFPNRDDKLLNNDRIPPPHSSAYAVRLS